MKTRHITIIVGLLLCLSLALAVPQAAMALGTPACTPIGNKADVQYTVAGAVQAIVSSNTNTFLVGNKVALVVTAQDASPGISVVPSQTGVLLNFRITNNGNSKERYVLSTKVFSGVTTSVFSGNNTVTDNFDAASVAAGIGTTPTTTTAVVNANGTLDVTIIGDMPLPPLSNGDKAVYALIAKAVNPTTGVLEIQNSNSNIDSAFGTCTSDIVLDSDTGTLDAGVSGASSARDAYNVVLTNLTVNKTSTVYSDPVNGTTNPKAIPGAIMEYIVGITNTGNQNATTVTITDTLPVTITPLPGAWTSKTGSFTGCPGQAQVSINGVAYSCLAGSSWSGQTLTAPIPTLISGQTGTILYQATIQ